MDPVPAPRCHTLVLSDLHLSEAEPSHPGNPLWKRYKRPRHFIDKSFKRFLEHVRESTSDPCELVFNGDVFDFDSTMALPDRPGYSVSWLERRRGLTAQEPKSRYKMSVILEDHPVWLEALRDWVKAGHRIVFVIGNHDLELHWPAVQAELIGWLALPEEWKDHVRFCEWFYVSNGDTLIEHGNQYDPYCVCSNPIHPLARKRGDVYVRLPFGNLAGRFMLNGMGLFNPHVDSSFIKSSFLEYAKFFYQYLLRIQPLLGWTWFWSSIVTFLYALEEAVLPALKDPLTFESRIEDIALRANATPRVVRSLAQLHVHPAILSPLKVMRELWLDRALLIVLALVFSFEVALLARLFAPLPIWSSLVLFGVLMPWVIRYARSVESGNEEAQRGAVEKLDLSSQIAGVERVVHGHTHRQVHRWIKGVEQINTGTWSPAFEDVECTRPFGLKCFAWIRPSELDGGDRRSATLYEWVDPGIRVVAPERILESEPRTRVLPRRPTRDTVLPLPGTLEPVPVRVGAGTSHRGAAAQRRTRGLGLAAGLAALVRAVLP